MEPSDERIARGLVKCPFMSSFKSMWGRKAAERAAATALSDVKGVAPLDPATQEAFTLAHGNAGIHPLARGIAVFPDSSGARAAEAVAPKPEPEQPWAQRLGLVLPATPEASAVEYKVIDAPFASATFGGFWVRCATGAELPCSSCSTKRLCRHEHGSALCAQACSSIIENDIKVL